MKSKLPLWKHPSTSGLTPKGEQLLEAEFLKQVTDSVCFFVGWLDGCMTDMPEVQQERITRGWKMAFEREGVKLREE
jgi:hypothetical protein